MMYIVFSRTAGAFLAFHLFRGEYRGAARLSPVRRDVFFTERGKRAILRAPEAQEFADIGRAKLEAERLNVEYPDADFRIYANDPNYGIGGEVKNA